MGKIVEQKSVAVEKPIPYINNAKQHSDDRALGEFDGQEG